MSELSTKVCIHIPTHLSAYTGGESQVMVGGATLGEALAELDQRFPGIRFRFITEQDEVREHMKVFVDREQVFDLHTPLGETSEIHIIAALSGG